MSTPTTKSTDPRERIHVVPDREPWHSGLDAPHGREEIVFSTGGVFVVRSDELLCSYRPADRSDFRRILGVPEHLWGAERGGVRLTWPVPFALLLQATQFFTAAWQRSQREEILFLFLYYEEGRYELFHPKITVGESCRVECEIPDAPDGAVRFGDFHSHGRRAHHSGEDLKTDLQSPGLHIVIGDVAESLPTLHCVCSTGDHCFPVSPWDVFEKPSGMGFPAAWLGPDVMRQPAVAAPPATPAGRSDVSARERKK